DVPDAVRLEAFERLVVQIGSDDDRALARKGDRAGATDTGCCCRHERTLALQSAGHWRTPSGSVRVTGCDELRRDILVAGGEFQTGSGLLLADRGAIELLPWRVMDGIRK